MSRALLSLALAGFIVASAGGAASPGAALETGKQAAAKGDFVAAKKVFLAEAEKGNAEAACLLGELLLIPPSDAASVREAASWFRKAADAGFPAGMFYFGQILETGIEGIPKDAEKSRFLIRAAAEAGHAPAQVVYAQVLEKEINLEGRKPDWSEPRRWLEKAAAQNSPDALFAMVRYFDEGLAGERDLVKGTNACLGAAKAGSSVAMNEMGVRYNKGRGISADNVAAIGWFSLAAQHHLPAAHVNLGKCYEMADGVVTDFNRAGENYAAAAKMGFGPAQLLLGELFESGKAGEPKPVFAYINYVRASLQGMVAAEKRRDSLKAKLSPAQLQEAERLLASPAAQPVGK